MRRLATFGLMIVLWTAGLAACGGGGGGGGGNDNDPNTRGECAECQTSGDCEGSFFCNTCNESLSGDFPCPSNVPKRCAHPTEPSHCKDGTF